MDSLDFNPRGTGPSVTPPPPQLWRAPRCDRTLSADQWLSVVLADFCSQHGTHLNVLQIFDNKMISLTTSKITKHVSAPSKSNAPSGDR